MNLAPLIAPLQSEPPPVSGGANATNLWEKLRSSVRRGKTALGSRVEFSALGTRCDILFEARCESDGDAFVSQAVPWVAAFEAKYARNQPGSVVSRINHLAGLSWVVLDDESDRLLSVCGELAYVTGGAFDPTVFPLTQLWLRAGREAVPPPAEEIEATLRQVGWRRVKRCSGGIYLPDSGMGIDLDSIAQSYVTDRLVQFAEWNGLRAVMVGFGRNTRCLGRPTGAAAWPINIESDAAPGGAWSVAASGDIALSACSGVMQRASLEGVWDEPVVDPRTGHLPVHGCHDVVVSAPHCTLAAALALAACVSGPDKGLALLRSIVGVEGAILTAGGPSTTDGFAINPRRD